MGIRVKPNKIESRSSGIKPFLENAKIAFPNMMRRITQTARDWGVKKRHSEMIKPYMLPPGTSYPEMDDLYPVPFSLENPQFGGAANWTNVNFDGEDAWRFLCGISCKHKVTAKRAYCFEPIKCIYDSWTALADGGVDGWSFKDANGDPINSLDVTWHPDKGISGEIWIMPKSGDWRDIIAESNYIKIVAYYEDKGNAKDEQYYHPIWKKWIQIVGGKSTCSSIVKVYCKECPVTPVMTFDDASTPDTIVPGNNITVYVLGGQGPFTWSVSGTGYSLASASTTARQNTLGCASGT